MNIFAKRLKNEREKKKNADPKWTQGYVADIIGVARSTYTAYENGTKQPPLETVNNIAEVFNVSTDYLLGRIDDPSPSDKLNNLPPLLQDIDPELVTKFLEVAKNPLEELFFGDILSASKEEREELIREFLLMRKERKKHQK